MRLVDVVCALVASMFLAVPRADAMVVCPDGATTEGVDVSHYQGVVDWSQVKASGRAFAFVRATSGNSTVDARFSANWADAKAAGLIRGAYHELNPDNDATGQADLFAQTVGALEVGDLPLAVKVDASPGDPSGFASALATFIDRVEQRTGYPMLILTGKFSWESGLGSSGDPFAAHRLWIADYGAGCPDLPASWLGWAMRQYSSTGSVPGIVADANLDAFNGTLGDLAALTGRMSLFVALDIRKSWQTSASAPWIGQARVRHDGVDAARSGVIAHGQSTQLKTTVVGPKTIAFWWKTSSEPGDKLRFYVDATMKAYRSGITGWQQKSFRIGKGTHVVKWAFARNASGSAGMNAGFVDQVRITTPAP